MSLADDIGSRFILNDINGCVIDADTLPIYDITNYLLNFLLDTPTLGKAFAVAAYISTSAWLPQQFGTGHILYDSGTTTQHPSISRLGIVLVSVFIGLFLSGIFFTASYATLLPRWTERLDSFAMMRLGASIHDKTPLLMAHSSEEADLDNVSGLIGDMAGDKEIGRIGLGGPTPLRRNRAYQAYFQSKKKERDVREAQ
jgi:hypothetical protein